MNNGATIDIWVVLTESGEYVVAKDEDTVSDLAEDEFGEDDSRRYVLLKA